MSYDSQKDAFKWLKTMSKGELREAYEKVTNEEDLHEFENHKQDILNKYMAKVEKVKQGEVNALDVGTDLKEFSDALDSLYDELKDHIVEERDKYDPKEDVIRNGYEIRNMSRTYYKYKQDPSYDFLKQKLKNRKEFIKKATNKSEPIHDPETGEMVEPVETSVSTYPVLKFVGHNQID